MSNKIRGRISPLPASQSILVPLLYLSLPFSIPNLRHVLTVFVNVLFMMETAAITSKVGISPQQAPHPAQHLRHC